MSHRKTIGFPLRILGAFALLGAAGLGHAAEQITHYTYSNGKIDQFFISEPTVTSAGGKFYPEILMRGGDTILVSAGGCVQTGGQRSNLEAVRGSIRPEFRPVVSRARRPAIP